MLGLQAEIIEADGQTWRPSTLADGVLLDAPCSATGTIRRHPDIQRTRAPQEVTRAAAVQAKLAAHAVDLLRPGGVLVFATCSLDSQEGPVVTANLLASDERLRRAPISAADIGGLAEAITEDGDLRSLPCHLGELGGMDGFYAARIIRK